MRVIRAGVSEGSPPTAVDLDELVRGPAQEPRDPQERGGPQEVRGARELLLEAARLATAPAAGPELARGSLDGAARLLAEPTRLRDRLAADLGDRVRRVVVSGTLDRRLLLLQRLDDRWALAELSGQPLGTRDWPAWSQGHLSVDRPGSWLSPADVDEEMVHRLMRPRVLLVALYHPEHFPLPRFPLGISDVARAARATLLGEVELMDMQLGTTLEDVLDRVRTWSPDILGVSATFGQHDLFLRLLDQVNDLPAPPLVVAGGSLTARNERVLLERYPSLLVARAAGESTMQDLLAHWHGLLDRDQVRGVGFLGGPRGEGVLSISRTYRHTSTVANRLQTDILPELDLLDRTFEHRGVAQLESSRGCTNYCSFCPRSHKGNWSGSSPEAFRWILREMDSVFARHPDISRTVYLVDEEFIGRGEDAVPRALAMAEVLHRTGFRWETSCRVDQVTRFDQDRSWHVERAAMWRTLVGRGLRRCLFGVESGVDSILERFNKETTAEQNAVAIRTLSALGVPTRFTYITFDHLMTEDELRASHRYQGRTDLILRPLPHLPVEEIVDGVLDPGFVAEHAAGRPFHSAISYMLVSMECLIGAAFTKRVEAAGLTGALRPSMGRVDARFADWRIGLCSEWAQLWVDRNFAFDYTLKSLEKILDGRPRELVRGARVVLKDAAYVVLGRMLGLVADFAGATPEHAGAMDGGLRGMAQEELERLRDRMGPAVREVLGGLEEGHAVILRRELGRWLAADGWTLINAADPCGT
jgi:radical SAM superfamily enzyme YgiQ (UPF0313 family)